MASTTVSEIFRLDLQEGETPVLASITDVKLLSSYNWIEAANATPTIAVPGNSGLIYIAQNAARHPESPLEPLFRALYITHPSFDIRSTDVVTDRNNIRKLLSFIDPSSTRNEPEAFTMNVEVTKNIAIFCRDEAKTLEYIGPQERKQNDLRKLAALIRKIINLVKECGGNAVLKYDVEGDKLVVCKVERKEMLPKDLYSKWDERHNLEAETDTQNDGIQGPKIAQTRRESMSVMRTTGDDLKAIIRIGNTDYSVHVFKIPYLASFV